MTARAALRWLPLLVLELVCCTCGSGVRQGGVGRPSLGLLSLVSVPACFWLGCVGADLDSWAVELLAPLLDVDVKSTGHIA